MKEGTKQGRLMSKAGFFKEQKSTALAKRQSLSPFVLVVIYRVRQEYSYIPSVEQ